MRSDELAARLLSMFVEELEEQLRVINEDLLTLERAPADSERLRSLFRSMHSLKGAARAANVAPIEELCHALEGELAQARDGQRPLTPPQLLHGFAASDALADAARRLRAGETIPVGEYDALLLAIRSGSPLPRSSGRSGAAESPPPAASPPPATAPAAAAEPVVEQRAVVRAPDSAQGEDAADEQLRVGARRLDGLTAAAAELREMSGTVAAWPEELETMRTQLQRSSATWKREGRADVAAVNALLNEVARNLAALERDIQEQARGADTVSLRLIESARHIRQRPFGDIAQPLARVGRDVGVQTGKTVRVVVSGERVEADRTVLEALREPLIHLVRNAADHGLETPVERERAGKPPEGTVHIEAALRGDRLTVTVSDDGRGLDLPAIRAALARKGRHVPADDAAVVRSLLGGQISTRIVATEISGRGVGLDAARAAVERIGGTLEVRWTRGAGTAFILEVPLSVATMRALLVSVGGHPIGVPTALVERVERAAPGATSVVAGERVLLGRAAPIRLASLGRLLGARAEEAPNDDQSLQVVVVVAAGARLALVVDELLEEREVVVRPIEYAASVGSRYVGAALLADGKVAPVLNVPGVIGEAGDRGVARFVDATAAGPARILVADDSITTRALEESVLTAAGYDVVTAPDGAEALRIIEAGGIDLLVTDVEMPNMTGLELCARIRASRANASLPVIIVSSLDRPEHRAQGMEAGADAYVTKSSFEQGELIALVERLLGSSR
jgi:two-component system, chemotaxis family, sensor kinase CheA